MNDARHNASASSLELLQRRVQRIDAAMQQMLDRRLDAVGDAARALCGADDVWVTGTGGSEGPARVLTSLLVDGGRRARFVPLSRFADQQSPARERRALVVFSQGLSPNAKLALRQSHAFEAVVLVSAVAPEIGAAGSAARRLLAELCDRGAHHIPHPPNDESGLLVRVIGPVAATLLAMFLAAEVLVDTAARDSLASRSRRELSLLAAHRSTAAAIGVPAHIDVVGLVTAGGYDRLVHGLRWKLLESTAYGDPSVWDVLQLAHGPYQQLYDRHALLIALETPCSGPLFDRLESILVAERHTLLRFRSELEPPLCWLQHDAMVNGIMLTLHEHAPRNLVSWPGQGDDAALYRLGESAG